MKNVAWSLAVAMLLGPTSAASLGSGAEANNKAKAEEYLRQVYAQVGETYLAQTETDEARSRRRREIKKEEYKTYDNIYPPAEGAVAKIRGDPWPCSEKEPCGEGEGTCRNPYEVGSHPDALCAEPFYCQDRVGGSRNGPGEHVKGVVFTGALKMHHMGANDICYDDEWETYGAPKTHMAVLRRKAVPCTHEKPCDVGEGDCKKDDANCNEGLSCAFRADDQTGVGEPLHGVEFTGDLLQNSDGANDLCYNPHWPNTPDADYEGKVVQSCDQGGKNCEADLYLVLDGVRRHIPNEDTFKGLWPGPEVITSKPRDAFKDIPISGPLCKMTPLFKGPHSDQLYLLVDGKKRLIANTQTLDHLKFKKDAVETVKQCIIDGLEDGIIIDYEGEEGPNSRGCDGGDGWTKVRHVPKGNTWHPTADQLKGTDIYGDPKDDTKAWSIKFPDGFTEFQFASGDCKMWLTTDKHELLGTGWYTLQPKQIKASSDSATPYKAKWWYRKGQKLDPLVSLHNWYDATKGYGDHGGILYMGNGNTGRSGEGSIWALEKHDGADVYVR